MATNSSVFQLQSWLHEISFTYPQIPQVIPDGIFGSETTQAVKIFQDLFGLPVTGVVDFDTWNKLKEVYDELARLKSPPLPIEPFSDFNLVVKQGDRGTLVYIIQVMLNEIAKKFKNLKLIPINGLFDAPTAEAVGAYQKYCGVRETGRVDRSTWDLLARGFEQHKYEIEPPTK